MTVDSRLFALNQLPGGQEKGDSIKIATPRIAKDLSLTDTNVIVENGFQKIMKDAKEMEIIKKSEGEQLKFVNTLNSLSGTIQIPQAPKQEVIKEKGQNLGVSKDNAHQNSGTLEIITPISIQKSSELEDR